MAEQDKVTVRVDACNFVKPNCLELVSGLTAKLCSKIDVNCATPIVDGISDQDGELVFDVPTGGAGFDGFLLIQAPTALCSDTTVFGPDADSLCALAPGCDLEQPDERCLFPTVPKSLFFFNPPIREERDDPFVVPLIPAVAVPQLVQAGGGGNVDPTKGFLFITAYGCDGQPAAGVSFTTSREDESSVPLYIDEGIISATAQETDESGLGGVAGVPSGFIEISGRTDSGKRVGAVGAQVAPFSITYVSLVPQ